jgi:serine/threonine-protein kinase
MLRPVTILPNGCSIELGVGDVLDGRYLLLNRAGSGGAGTVWRARDLRRDIDVAVKVLRDRHLASEDLLARFVRERELASRMLSPHIVRVLSHGITAESGPYVVYEHLDGDDLATIHARRRRLSIVETRTVVVHTCRALARAHALGVLHCDVKPGNLFVSTDHDGRMVIKVLDFGIAELAGGEASTEHTSVSGTLEYIAPEVLFGEKSADARSDLYAVAVIAYECLTGQVPRPAESIGELVAAFAQGSVAPPSTLRRGLSPEFDAWFERALHRDPAARFASASEMADAFQEAVDSLDHVPSTMRRVAVEAREIKAGSALFADEPLTTRAPVESMIVPASKASDELPAPANAATRT